MTKFKYTRHPHISNRAKTGPIKVNDQHCKNTKLNRFNTWLAVKICNGVGTMWCAYVFGVLALLSLPAILTQANIVSHNFFPHFIISPGLILLVAWIAQTFLQLVLLSIIIVGQNVQAQASDKRAEQTYLDAEAVLRDAQQIQEHLIKQDEELELQTNNLKDIITRLESLPQLKMPASRTRNTTTKK